MENQDSIYLFLDIIGGMLGPVIGVMMAHYFVVMRGQINLDELYTAPGDYKYYDNGFNLTAFSVTLVAVILSLAVSLFLYGTVITCFMVCRRHRRLCGLRLIKETYNSRKNRRTKNHRLINHDIEH